MAFINPSTLSSVSRKEFDELKEKVDKIENELNNASIQIPTNNQTATEIIIENNELNKKQYEVRNNINITNAKLNGAPRIEFFDLSKNKQKIEDVQTIEDKESSNNIINMADVLDSITMKEYTYKYDNIPTTAKTSSGHRTTTMSESKLNYLKQGYYAEIKKIGA